MTNAVHGVHKEFFNTKEAAEYTGFSEVTLRKWRIRGEAETAGRGPRYCKPTGRSVRYAKTDLDAFLSRHPRD